MARYAIVVRPAPLLERNSVNDWRDSAALDGQTDGTFPLIPPSGVVSRDLVSLGGRIADSASFNSTLLS